MAESRGERKQRTCFALQALRSITYLIKKCELGTNYDNITNGVRSTIMFSSSALAMLKRVQRALDPFKDCLGIFSQTESLNDSEQNE